MVWRVFSDDFKTYTVGQNLPMTKWTQEGGRTTPVVVDAATDGGVGPLNGSQMLRFNINGSQYDSIFVNIAPLHTNEFFIRAWMRFDTNMDGPGNSSGLHVMRFFDVPGPINFYWLDTEASPGAWNTDVIINNTSIGPAVFGDFPGYTNWFKFERYADIASGTIKSWNNGVAMHNVTGHDFGSEKASEFFPMSNWGNNKPDATNHCYMDGFEVFTDLNTGDGEATTGLMSDATIQVAAGSPIVSIGNMSLR